MDQVKFLKDIFHKFYWVHSWILCPIFLSDGTQHRWENKTLILFKFAWLSTKVVKFTISIYYSNNALSEQVISWGKTSVIIICYCPFLYQKYQDSFTKVVLYFLITAPSYTIYQRMTHRNHKQCHEKNPCM